MYQSVVTNMWTQNNTFGRSDFNRPGRMNSPLLSGYPYVQPLNSRDALFCVSKKSNPYLLRKRGQDLALLVLNNFIASPQAVYMKFKQAYSFGKLSQDNKKGIQESILLTIATPEPIAINPRAKQRITRQ